jgi:hypothetical protein
MVTNTLKLGPDRDSTDKANYHLYEKTTDPFSHQEGGAYKKAPQMSENSFSGEKKNWSQVPDGSLIP